MTPQVWIRNPTGCIQEVVEAGCTSIAFDEGWLAKKRRIDVPKFLSLYFRGRDYEWLMIQKTGSKHFTSADPENRIASYPVWDSRFDGFDILEEMCSKPVGEDKNLINQKSLPDHQRPIAGQRHIVIVQSLPPMVGMQGKKMLQTIHEISKDYGTDIYVHGLYGFISLINYGFPYFDFEPRAPAAHGDIFLPSGKKIKVETDAHRHVPWLNALGHSLNELRDPKQRCIYNVKAARWAAQHGINDYVFASKASSAKIDSEVSNEEYVPAQAGTALAKGVIPISGDKMECDTCSLWEKCKLYREGSVCTLPESETKSLAQLAGSRNTDHVLDAMARLTTLSVERAETGMAFENKFGIDPEVTKLFKQAFEFAERYAKLRNPALRANLNVNKNQEIPVGGEIERPQYDSAEDAARAAISHFAEKGISQDQITPEMMKEFLIDTMKVPALPAADSEVYTAEVVRDTAT